MDVNDNITLTIMALAPTLAVAVNAYFNFRVAAVARRIAESTATHLSAISSDVSATHKIVNSQRSVMLKLVAELSRRIAQDNPSDMLAQIAAKNAADDAVEWTLPVQITAKARA